MKLSTPILFLRDRFILEDDKYGPVDRLAEIVIRGKHNIFPKENQHLHTNHSTESCQFFCCGIPQARLGKEICAGIRIKPGSNITLRLLQNSFESKNCEAISQNKFRKKS
jgi:acyl-CoA synthetase (AMP-forming)/AMP-acid ligase II